MRSCVVLPDEYDPNDSILKTQLHPKADDKNIIDKARKKPILICGAMRNGVPCRQPAGAGTSHLGYGRCKYHGGCSTGPKTEDGKDKVSQNARVHGFYSKALLPEEAEILRVLANQPSLDLIEEIRFWKTKVIHYLARIAEQYKKEAVKSGESAAYHSTRVLMKGKDGVGFYHAGTIEDPILDRALNTLRQLVLTQNKIKDADASENLIELINAELRAASQGQVSLSWGGKAQISADQ